VHRLGTEEERHRNQRQRLISEAQEAFESGVFVLPDSGVGGIFLQTCCLLLGDKESKPCPWLLSLKLHLTEGFYVSLPLECVWDGNC
jgi:hypothetical protein